MGSGGHLTKQLGEFLADVRYENLPTEALPLVRDAFTDTVGVIMVGIDEPVVDIVRRELVQDHSRPEARACLSDRLVSTADAALLGGTAAHALDYDDQSLSGHPSAVLVPALLAEGELLGSSGKDLITAYVAGYEVWAELVRRSSNYHRKGWHPTSVFGTIGAAAGTAVLRRMPAERAATALAIAASHSSGIAANFGTMTKPYHAGAAARNGVVATRLASAGMTAGHDALENRQGFLTAVAGAENPDLDSPSRAGEEWYLVRQRLCIKKYATCYFMHRSFDATVKMLAGERIGADEIDEIEVTMGKGQTAVLTNENPQTGLQAKFSEQFAIAAAVILGRMGVAELTDDIVRRPDIQAFFPKVKVVDVDEYDERDPAHSPTEQVRIKLRNRRILDSGPIARIKGHAYDPLTREELWTKFLDCTSLTHSRDEAERLFTMLQAIEELGDTVDLPTCHKLFKN